MGGGPLGGFGLVLIALVGPGGVGEDGGAELVGELAAHAGHAEGGVAGDLAGDGLVLDLVDGLLELSLEVLEEARELGFELARSLLLLGASLGVEPRPLRGNLFHAPLQRYPLGCGGGELVVQLVEKSADIGLLGGHLPARFGDDLGLHPEPFGDVQPGRGAGNSEPQLVGGGQGRLVEADCRVEDSGVFGGVDLEGGEVGGDGGPGMQPEKVGGNRDGQSRTLLRVGGGAELIEQDERALVGVGAR